MTKANETNMSVVPEGFTEIESGDVASGGMIGALTNTSQSFFSSIVGTDRASQVKTFNAINNVEYKLSDHLGEVLEIVDVVAHTIMIENETTKKADECLRVVLITKEGVCYESVSLGIASSLQKLFALFGNPTWVEPVKIVAGEVKTRKGFKVMTLRCVE